VWPFIKQRTALLVPVASASFLAREDRYVFNPNKSSANVVLNATRGAFRFAGGQIEGMRQKNVVFNTPNAALAVRGTHFWADPIEGKYGVLLLKGKVRVSGR